MGTAVGAAPPGVCEDDSKGKQYIWFRNMFYCQHD